MGRPKESEELVKYRRDFIVRNHKEMTIDQMRRSLNCSCRVVADHLSALNLRKTYKTRIIQVENIDLSKETGIFDIDTEAVMFGYSDGTHNKKY